MARRSKWVVVKSTDKYAHERQGFNAVLYEGYYKLCYSGFNPKYLREQMAAIRQQHGDADIKAYLNFIAQRLNETWLSNTFYGDKAVYNGADIFSEEFHPEQIKIIRTEMENSIAGCIRQRDFHVFPEEAETLARLVKRNVTEFVKVLQSLFDMYGISQPFDHVKRPNTNAQTVVEDAVYLARIHPSTSVEVTDASKINTPQETTHGDVPQPLRDESVSPIDLRSTVDASILLTALKALAVIDVTDAQFAAHFTVNGQPVASTSLKGTRGDIRRGKRKISSDTEDVIRALVDDVLAVITECDANTVKQLTSIMQKYTKR